MATINDLLCEFIQREKIRKLKLSSVLSVFVELEKMGALKIPEDWQDDLLETIKNQEME